jgi:hypothetical protein
MEQAAPASLLIPSLYLDKAMETLAMGKVPPAWWYVKCSHDDLAAGFAVARSSTSMTPRSSTRPA